LIITSSNPSNWIIINNNKLIKKIKISNQLILTRDQISLFSALLLRNNINKVFKNKNIKSFIISLIIIIINRRNLVIIIIFLFINKFLIEKQTI
jgi:hypothetical protein